MSSIPYHQVPRGLHLEIVHEIANYSVALARISRQDPASFQILGSGTCVKRGANSGILTAHHVLHEQRPRVRLGAHGPDRIVFLAKNGRTPAARQDELVELPLGTPASDDRSWGPDLTFIPLPADSSLRGICSFWNLDRDPTDVLREFAVEGACIVNAGYPAFKHDIAWDGNNVHANVTLYGGNGALALTDIVEREGWDFINSECDYGAFPRLPESYGGMSGGGIWSALLNLRDGKVSLRRLALMGVNFWETAVTDGKRNIRGHFVRSIYARAWANS